MKKLFAVGCWLLALAVGQTSLAAVKTAVWTLPADWEAQVEYVETDGRLTVRGGSFGYPTEPVGAPALPFLPVSIAVPEGSVCSNCTVEATWAPVDTALRPAVVQEPHVVGEEPVETPEDPAYFGAARYPARPESVGGVQTCAGEASIQAWVTPYRWNGQAGKLEKATSLKLTFTYVAPRAAMKLKTSSADAYTGVMYIISPPNFTNLWQTYVDYRKTTHPTVAFHIVDTQTEIYDVAAYDGHDDALRIHKYLEARYAEAKAAGRKMYAILGAGCAKGNESYDRATMIPLRMTAAANTYYYPGDLYYSCMDKVDNKGEVWDYDSDQVYLGYKKSGGGYASDAAWKVDWLPDIAAFRFPVRTSAWLEDVSKAKSKTYSAQEQINGLVNKLKIYEGAAGKSRPFGGHFTYSVSYHKLFEDMYRGSTDDKIAGERSFFDGIANMWSASHNATIEDSEMITRYLNYAYATTGRPVAGAVNNTQVPNNDVEITTHSSHGQEQTAAPFQAYDFFANSRIQFFMNTGTSCLTGKIDTGDVDGHGNLCFAEACVLNPNGGAIVTLNNTREGWGAYPGYHETLSLVMQAGLINGFYRLGDGTAYGAFIKGHKYAVDRVGNPSGTMAGCYVESNMMGDPLAKLSPINDTGTFVSPVDGWFLKDATATNSVNFTGTSGSVNLTVTPATANEEVTLSGSQYKVTGGVTVNNGATLKWNAPGGFGRNGIAFSGSRGKIVCEGANSRYFGTRFSGIDEILVTGYNTTFDFDKTGATRDVTALKFIGSDTNGIAKCNYIRSREGGIFSPSMSIPVRNGTLVLQTTNIGGSGNASDTTTPIFTLTNAVLKIAENPHWANEMLNRPVWMNGATITVAYQSFGFGAKVSGSKGMALRVLDKTSNTISGSYDAEINGPFNVEVLTNAVLKIHVPLTKSSYAGSLVKTGEGRLELRAANTFAGGIAVNAGTMVFGKEALTSSACGEVTVASNATLQIEALPLASVTKLTVKAGGRLILPGDDTTASYQLVDPMVGSLNFEEGALVYNVNDLTKTLNGSTTSDGYYMDTSSFLHWQDKDGTWTNGTAADGTKWLKGGEATNAVDFANGNSVMFNNSTNAGTRHVAVSGSLQPGYITLNNTKTAYSFTNAAAGAKISLENLYTIGDTSFEPEVSAGSKVVVTSGRATYNNLTTASLSVAPEGKLQLKGTLTPATYINKIVLKVTDVPGWVIYPIGTSYQGYSLNELQFYNGDELLTLPVGTVVTGVGSGNNDTMTITGSANGRVTGYSGGGNLHNLFDGSASTGWGWYNNNSTIGNAKPSYTITITLGAPMRMFTGYKFGSADKTERNPKAWTLTVTENSSGSSTQVDSRSGMTGTAANWWPSANYPYYVTYSGASSASVDVSEGGTLFLDGTYNAPITVGEDARLSVTNDAKLTASKGFSMNGSVTLDVSEAGKYGWTEVLHGANLATTSLSKFVLNSDDAAAKIESGNLFVATEGVKKGPYANAFSGDNWDWNTTGWKGNGVDFGCTWSEAITRMADDAFVTINNSSTGTLGCAVSCNTIFFTNATDNAQTVRVNGSGSVNCNALDFSGLKGEVAWSPDLNGANVIAGTNRVILLSGNGGKLSAASNAYVSTVGKFASYDIANGTRIHFANTGRALTMADLPDKGVLSFAGMTLDCGTAGAFQRPNITYFSEEGDTLVLNGVSGNNARMTSSFDIRGGSVTVNPSGSWWFGVNGVTKYEQTGGTFLCNATGTTVGSSGSGMVLGYDGESSFALELNVAGGRFDVPNGIVNIWNPSVINLFTNGVLKTKGIGARSGVTGTVNINEESTLEVGSSALSASGMTYNLYGGTLAAFENTTVSAPITLGSAGTLAASENTTLTVAGAVSADGATLNVGAAGYAGTVRFTVLPTGVTNFTVTAGTWDLGSLRPTNAVLTALAGTVAAELTDDELRKAAQGGLKLIRTSLSAAEVAGRVAVVTSAGISVPATGGVSGDGFLLLSVSYVEPLYATTDGATAWLALDWKDAIGMPFRGEWTEVNNAVVSNVADGAALEIPAAFTKSLKIVNSGRLALSGETEVAALDDSASTGETRVGCATANVTAGADTVVERVGSGTLTLASGMRATMWNGVDWPTAKLAGFSGTAEIRYAGSTDATALKYTSGQSANGVVCYAETVSTGAIGFDYSLTRKFEDGLKLTAERLVLGNQNNSSQTFRQTGGEIVVTGAGDITASEPTGVAPLLFSHWNNPVTYYLTGGSVVATNGVNGSTYFGRDGVPKLYVGGGEAKATLRTNGLINDSRTNKDKEGSVLELKPNGVLEIGNKGFALYRNAELRLSGGTFLAYESASMSSAKFTLTADTASTLAAADGETLTVNTVPTGTGRLVCGDGANGGRVVLKGGSWAGVTLGGTFEIWLTAAQEAATANVDLFVPGEDYDAAKVTVLSSTGGEPDGTVCLFGGKVTFVPSAAFRLPIVGEVYTNNTPWHLVSWHDSSAEPKAFDPLNLPNVAEVVLNAHADAAVLCDYTQTLQALRICGEGTLTLRASPSTLTLTKAVIETDVVAEGAVATFTAAEIAEGGSLSVAVAKAPASISGAGTLVSEGTTLPVSSGLTDPAKWTGTVKLTGTLNANLDMGTICNAQSGVEFAGQLLDSNQGYLKVPTVISGRFVLTSTMKIQNGNSKSIQAKFCGPFSGTGTFVTAGTAPYNKDVFQILGDASGFLGSIKFGCVYHDISFGEHTWGAGGKIFVDIDSGATIGAGATWDVPNGIDVASGGVLNIAYRGTDTAASPSTVTVAQGGWLNLLRTADGQDVFKVTSGTLNLTGGVKVNGVPLGSDQYAKDGGTITLKAGTLTWNGGAEGVWSTTSNCWRTASGADVAWHDGFAGGNTARFASAAAVTLEGPVAPALIDLAVPTAELTCGDYVQKTATVVFENLNLANVTSIAGDMYGNYITSKGAATPCFVTRTAEQIAVQFQKRDNELKCVKVVLTQDGANVRAQALWAAYANAADPGTTDFENASHNGTVVTADSANGYGIKNLSVTTSANGELTVRAAQNFAGPVVVTNGLLRLTAGELGQDLSVAAGSRLDLAAEAYAVTNVITSGKLTGVTLDNVTVNGMALAAAEWTLDGNRLIRDTSNWIVIGAGETATVPEGLSGRKAEVFVDAAGGTLATARACRLDAMDVIGGALTLKVTGDGMFVATNGISAGEIAIDASALDGVALAKCAVAGVPCSRWLVRGDPLPTVSGVALPEVPTRYSVTNETVAGVGVRLVVTAPVMAKFGAFGVNVHGGTELDKTETASGIYPLAHALWGNLKAEANKSTSVSNVSFTVGASASSWNAANAVDALQKQYMDDNGGCERTISLAGLGAFGPYRLIVYFSTDSADIKFCPVRVNGVPYAAVGGLSVCDLNANWGDTGPSGGSRDVAEGVNALATDVLTADSVVLGFERVSAGVARATPCAVQVVKVGEYVVPGKDFTATIDGDEHWDGISFSEIAWDGEAYEPGPNNTVTLTVTGDVFLKMDCALELQEFVVAGGEGGGYLSFSGSGALTVEAATAKVALFDFGGAASVFSPYDFGARIVTPPSRYFVLTAPHSGTLQDGYSYQGEGNAFTGSAFAGTKVSVSADSTLAGEFDVTAGGTVNFGYGTVTSSANTFLGATKGTVEVGAWTEVTVPHLRFLNSSDDANHAVLNLYGTLNVDSVSTQWDVWADRGSYRGILFGHWCGTGEYNVGIYPYDETKRGRLVGEAAYLELVYTAGEQTLNVSGGTVRVRGITANKTGGTVNLTDGGRLELAEGFHGAAIVQNYGYGTVSAYSYAGSAGWTNAQEVTLSDTTVDANGLALGFTGVLSGEGYVVIDDTSAGGGGRVTFGANLAGRTVYADGGTFELAAADTVELAYLELQAGARLELTANAAAPALATLENDGAYPLALDGVTVDLIALPSEASAAYKLVSADAITGTPTVGPKLAAAGWTLKVVSESGKQVLTAVKQARGTFFFVR